MTHDGTVHGVRESAADVEQPNAKFNAKRPSIREYLKAELSLLRQGPASRPVFEERKAACLSCTIRNPHPEDPIGLCGACGRGDRIRARLSIKMCPLPRWNSAEELDAVNRRFSGEQPNRFAKYFAGYGGPSSRDRCE